MWYLVTIGNQWTCYTENIFNSIAINNNQYDSNQEVMDYTEVYPFPIYRSNIPTDTTVFIYCIVSMRHTEKIYIVEKKYLSQILVQHNSCNGSQVTSYICYIP